MLYLLHHSKIEKQLDSFFLYIEMFFYNYNLLLDFAESFQQLAKISMTTIWQY